MDFEPDLFSTTYPTFTPINDINSTEEAMDIPTEDEQGMASPHVIPKTEVQEDTPMKNTPANNTSVTPRKRGRKPKDSTTNGDDEATPSTPSKRGRLAKKETSNSTSSETPSGTGTNGEGSGNREQFTKRPGPIPTTLEAASEADRMIIRMKDEENRPWAEINEAWMKMTGVKVGQSTVRMRYSTMKANFVSVTAEDETRLLRLKKDIEENFEQEKWGKIAKAIEDDGGSKYPLTALQKKFKQLCKSKDAPMTAVQEEA